MCIQFSIQFTWKWRRKTNDWSSGMKIILHWLKLWDQLSKLNKSISKSSELGRELPVILSEIEMNLLSSAYHLDNRVVRLNWAIRMKVAEKQKLIAVWIDLEFGVWENHQLLVTMGIQELTERGHQGIWMGKWMKQCSVEKCNDILIIHFFQHFFLKIFFGVFYSTKNKHLITPFAIIYNFNV